MESFKSWYQSKAIQGNIITAFGLLVGWLKLPIMSDEITTGVAAIFVLIGIGYSIYGRVKAKSNITK